MAEPAAEFDEIHDVEEPKRLRLSLHLIAKRHLPPESNRWNQEKIVEELNKITHLRLDRENIGHIDGLELLGKKVTNIYLQQNKIRKIENLECLPNLQFMTLASNNICKIEGLLHLTNLKFLDLSNNSISQFDIDELPQSLVILNLSGNPCTSMADYRGTLIQDLPNLRQLDEEAVTRQERREVGYVVSSESEEEEEEEEGEGEAAARMPTEGIFQVTATDILARSQSRLEATFKEHKDRLTMLDEVRTSSDLPPSQRAAAKPRKKKSVPWGNMSRLREAPTET